MNMFIGILMKIMQAIQMRKRSFFELDIGKHKLTIVTENGAREEVKFNINKRQKMIRIFIAKNRCQKEKQSILSIVGVFIGITVLIVSLGVSNGLDKKYDKQYLIFNQPYKCLFS